MRIFLDTNVLVSAYTARGLCADLVRFILAKHEFITGEVNLAEIRRVLAEHFKASAVQIDAMGKELRDHLVVPKPRRPSLLKLRDPDDRWVLASAEAAGADLLVTGDQDLLIVARDAPVLIVTPRSCWERLRTSE